MGFVILAEVNQDEEQAATKQTVVNMELVQLVQEQSAEKLYSTRGTMSKVLLTTGATLVVQGTPAQVLATLKGE